MERPSSRPSIDPTSDIGGHAAHGAMGNPRASTRNEQIPKAVGVLLLAAGMVTGMLPPPPGPSTYRSCSPGASRSGHEGSEPSKGGRGDASPKHTRPA